jgi:poly(A) polymerase
MHAALAAIRDATRGTPFEGRLWLVGGAVRDELLGRPAPTDYDLVTDLDAAELARRLHEARLALNEPVTYARFGTALIRVAGVNIELATARRESYAPESRKPQVEPATLEEDAKRRDFTVNALLRNLHTGELFDPLGTGLIDLDRKVLRTPLEPAATFRDDPLRMLRAVRFVWTLDFQPAEGLYEAIAAERERLAIVSAERIRDEFSRMLLMAEAAPAMEDLRRTGLLQAFAPELDAMKGVEQGSYHHLDVWDHTLLVLRNAPRSDLVVRLGALLHDVGKPQTQTRDEHGNIRFFQHETVGESIARRFLERLRYPSSTVEAVSQLVRGHMRLHSAPKLTDAAIRRLIRDLGDNLGRLLDVVEADVGALRPGVKAMDVGAIRERIAEVQAQTPRETLECPLSGKEIMELTGLEPGPEIGRIKQALLDEVLEGRLPAGDAEAARLKLKEWRE